MSIIDLHNIELLDNFGVDFQLLFFKWRHYLLTQVDRDDVMQHVQVVNFFVSLQK